MSNYAQRTNVPIPQTKAEIESMLIKHEAKGLLSGSDYETGAHLLQFFCHDRLVRFTVKMPDIGDYLYTESTRKMRSDDNAHKAFEQGCRQRMRQFLLVLKAKFEAVEASIETFDQAFMAHIVWPDGQTTTQILATPLMEAYATGQMIDTRRVLQLPEHIT